MHDSTTLWSIIILIFITIPLLCAAFIRELFDLYEQEWTWSDDDEEGKRP